ncbi:hypothetical protein, partial [uncultured Bilophila sp.]|uniref:hypothetical protein n=1 Tax=uncultured Bilophila sp. TaxID=529385 RepID=UPI0026486B7C
KVFSSFLSCSQHGGKKRVLGKPAAVRRFRTAQGIQLTTMRNTAFERHHARYKKMMSCQAF